MTKHGFDFDLFVIGGGSGGVRAARMSAQMGARAAIAKGQFGAGCRPHPHRVSCVYGAATNLDEAALGKEIYDRLGHNAGAVYCQ